MLCQTLFHQNRQLIINCVQLFQSCFHMLRILVTKSLCMHNLTRNRILRSFLTKLSIYLMFRLLMSICPSLQCLVLISKCRLENALVSKVKVTTRRKLLIFQLYFLVQTFQLIEVILLGQIRLLISLISRTLVLIYRIIVSV